MKKLQLTFNKKYLTAQRIGFGTHAEIYLAYEIETEKQIAIKLQSSNNKDSTLQRQAKFYRLVKGGTGIPNLYWYGIEHERNALVTDLYGPSLEQLLKYCKGTFTLKTVLLIADQALDRIQWVHSKGLVYNNIQPDNFLSGLREKQDKIFLIDYGSCQKYLDENNIHFKLQNEKESIKLNIKFKSVNTHINKKTGRRDDLLSLGYMFVYFLKGKLPWDQIKPDEQDYDLKVKEKKMSIPLSLLCDGLPKQFTKYFEYVESLEFEEEPDYQWIKRLFKDLFDYEGFTNNRVLDWAERHRY